MNNSKIDGIASEVKTLKAHGADFIGTMIREFPDGSETVFDIATDESGKKTVEVRRRQLQPEQPSLAPLARSRPAAHKFHTADSVTSYLSQYGDESTVVIADASALEAVIVLNEKVELGGHTELSYRPEFHPVFRMWREFFSSSREILQFAQFVMENRRQITQPDGRELALLLGQVKMAKTITVNRGKGIKAINGVMTTVEISGQKNEMPVELPEVITISCPIFLTDDAVDVEWDLVIYEQDGHVLVKGSNPELNALIASNFIESIEYLEAHLKTLQKGIVTFGKHGRGYVAELDA